MAAGHPRAAHRHGRPPERPERRAAELPSAFRRHGGGWQHGLRRNAHHGLRPGGLHGAPDRDERRGRGGELHELRRHAREGRGGHARDRPRRRGQRGGDRAGGRHARTDGARHGGDGRRVVRRADDGRRHGAEAAGGRVARRRRDVRGRRDGAGARHAPRAGRPGGRARDVPRRGADRLRAGHGGRLRPPARGAGGGASRILGGRLEGRFARLRGGGRREVRDALERLARGRADVLHERRAPSATRYGRGDGRGEVRENLLREYALVHEHGGPCVVAADRRHPRRLPRAGPDGRRRRDPGADVPSGRQPLRHAGRALLPLGGLGQHGELHQPELRDAVCQVRPLLPQRRGGAGLREGVAGELPPARRTPREHELPGERDVPRAGLRRIRHGRLPGRA